jgi:hypothetical protein
MNSFFEFFANSLETVAFKIFTAENAKMAQSAQSL